MVDIVVYGFSPSTYVRTVRLALEEKGAAYDLEPVTPGSPEIESKHPFGKIPAFRHGDVELFETLAITTYIDRILDGPDLHPDDPIELARMHQWISAYNDSFYRPGVTIVIQRVAAPNRGQVPDEEKIAGQMPATRKACRVFDSALAGRDWLSGGRLTLADMFLAPMIFYLQMIPEGDELFSGLDNLGRWYAAIAGRASFTATGPDLTPD